MKEMADNSVDSIVTDPPYELGFMGKSWDASGIAFNIQVWQEALRVLKPGGHLIAFSGSRTYHRMAVAIEDAGFQIRDQIMWVYGSGFPKSLDVSKAIDKAAGAEREVIGQKIRGDVEEAKSKGSTYSVADANKNNKAIFGYGIEDITVVATPAAKQWQGWGTALKPAHEPMVLARKPVEGTVANNVLTYGVGGLNIDGTRVEGVPPSVPQPSLRPQGFDSGHALGTGEGRNGEMSQAMGRFPANFIHDGSDEVLALFPDTKSQQSNRGNINLGSFGGYADSDNGVVDGTDSIRGFNDSGSAARFFYCAKASKRDRNEGLDDFEEVRTGAMQATADGSMLTGSGNQRTTTRANHHPTVKPTDLMRYLCRLITPPAGIVLDPFMGSGSTGKAAILEGFDFIGIDQSAEYVEIAKARIEWAVKELEGKLL